MQYRTYVTVVKGVLLHSTTSIIVLAVAITTIVPTSSNKSYSRQVVMRAISLVLHRQCIAFKKFFESVKMAANTVPKPPCTHHRDNLSYWRIFEWRNKYTVL